jgi:hypothetical protein
MMIAVSMLGFMAVLAGAQSDSKPSGKAAAGRG